MTDYSTRPPSAYASPELSREPSPLINAPPNPTAMASPALYDAVINGCRDRPRSIPAKFLYDDRGSQLFNQICQVDEYYLTRTEIALTRQRSRDIAAHIGSRPRLVELGAGSGLKTAILIESLLDQDLTQYVPIDISSAELRRCVNRLRQRFPELSIHPLCTDYTASWYLPEIGHEGRTLAYFPGSTIGNFSPNEAASFLSCLAAQLGPRGSLLVGVDLVKDPHLLEAAYNDRQGVTAAFNLNLLRRINRECGADFNLDAFQHRAVYQPRHERIEMRLISQRPQTVHLPDLNLRFEPGDVVVTEHSYKYRVESFARLAEGSCWRTRSLWTDDDRLFSLWLLETTDDRHANHQPA